ncbi:uncharacterized protein L969DRAFT_89198 [Mixia osmundae IAM 14324]|uniref:Uncharacterized protein n=1 Tax=Mixia osmundae (strain CBS 9802 / IAM 14324 / JCM 22182 / KY 12970) TaxID=764103 RepID=G7DSI4_MIXOS|nr:uncharacterized protein L969DRAFT_89198 [Mixia osmundae IAM 14324]KEI37958.1 hypothetical protein L969DRAFT_89198 [Mixia osmundae IAM 14324]GAA93544.1 hypothetical protein E5Q_00188 [Mixia osmundae IAM 14324]
MDVPVPQNGEEVSSDGLTDFRLVLPAKYREEHETGRWVYRGTKMPDHFDVTFNDRQRRLYICEAGVCHAMYDSTATRLRCKKANHVPANKRTRRRITMLQAKGLMPSPQPVDWPDRLFDCPTLEELENKPRKKVAHNKIVWPGRIASDELVSAQSLPSTSAVPFESHQLTSARPEINFTELNNDDDPVLVRVSSSATSAPATGPAVRMLTRGNKRPRGEPAALPGQSYRKRKIVGPHGDLEAANALLQLHGRAGQADDDNIDPALVDVDVLDAVEPQEPLFGI